MVTEPERIEPADREALLTAIRACTVCSAHLPLGPRPIVRAPGTARILLISQAPGTAAHRSGIPWDDPSGKRLKAWLGVDEETFHGSGRFAVVPMGFCYPGRINGSGDAPPRPECAPLWHKRLLSILPDVRWTLLIGMYAQRTYLKDQMPTTMTAAVRDHARFADRRTMPLPHPSWRVQGWMKRNPWFEEDVLPTLRAGPRLSISPTVRRTTP
ncbi:MAG: uracil-DNA glycosylase family protein [Myxococcota bacterium]